MKRFAAFDIDGTLIRWQLYHAVVDRLAKLGHLGLDAHEKLHTERMIWKRREHIDAFSKYEEFLIGLYEQALDNLQPRIFDAIVKEVSDEYKNQIYVFSRDLIKKLHNEGYFLLAISGSHTEMVEVIAKQHGFHDWVGTVYHRGSRGFTGQKFVASKDKKSLLKNLISKHHLSTEGSYAIGDSNSDEGMLSIVDNPIAFNPDRKLYDRAKALGWPIVVERKNVIYRLESQTDGSYLLA